jgi:hypothetical protein
MNLCDLFDLSFQGRRDQVALEFGDKTSSFRGAACARATASPSIWPIRSG